MLLEISGEIIPERMMGWSQNENNTQPRKNDGLEPKRKQYPAVDVTGDRSKVR